MVDSTGGFLANQALRTWSMLNGGIEGLTVALDFFRVNFDIAKRYCQERGFQFRCRSFAVLSRDTDNASDFISNFLLLGHIIKKGGEGIEKVKNNCLIEKIRYLFEAIKKWFGVKLDVLRSIKWYRDSIVRKAEGELASQRSPLEETIQPPSSYSLKDTLVKLIPYVQAIFLASSFFVSIIKRDLMSCVESTALIGQFIFKSFGFSKRSYPVIVTSWIATGVAFYSWEPELS